MPAVWEGFRCGLHYIRDKEKREVDFAITREGIVDSLIEVKTADKEISKTLICFSERLKPKVSIQVVFDEFKPYRDKGINVIPATKFLSNIDQYILTTD